MEFLGRFLAGAVVVVAVVLVNGGYVYETTCPLASGATQSSWTYGINDIIPYIRSTTPPCYSHTATRLALSWVGIAPLSHSTRPKTITAADRQAASFLAIAVSATSTEYAQETVAAKALTQEMRAKGVTPALRQKLIRLINEATAAWRRIKATLDATSNASDSQLIDARKSVSTYLGYEIATDQQLISGGSSKDFNAQYRSKIQSLVQHLRYLGPVIEARYPNVKSWGFLPAK